jgi:hypothetical protein
MNRGTTLMILLKESLSPGRAYCSRYPLYRTNSRQSLLVFRSVWMLKSPFRKRQLLVYTNHKLSENLLMRTLLFHRKNLNFISIIQKRQLACNMSVAIRIIIELEKKMNHQHFKEIISSMFVKGFDNHYATIIIALK